VLLVVDVQVGVMSESSEAARIIVWEHDLRDQSRG
jgi:hypothetical protein